MKYERLSYNMYKWAWPDGATLEVWCDDVWQSRFKDPNRNPGSDFLDLHLMHDECCGVLDVLADLANGGEVLTFDMLPEMAEAVWDAARWEVTR